MILVFHEKAADGKHQDQTGQHHGKGGDEASQRAPYRGVAGIGQTGVSHVCGTVDSNGAGRALADGHNVCELAVCHPMVTAHNLALYHGNHGIAAPETEQANLEECPEEF